MSVGIRVGGPITHNHTFFFLNYEGCRHVMADPMIETVPTPEEIGGDFSMSGTNIYDPTNFAANPSYDPTQPTTASNPKIIRQQFQYNGMMNVIPPSQINPAAQAFLQKYVPQPNMEMGMMACGAASMGNPNVVGAGMDCNNYLDVRNELEVNDQGTIRIEDALRRSAEVDARRIHVKVDDSTVILSGGVHSWAAAACKGLRLPGGSGRARGRANCAFRTRFRAAYPFFVFGEVIAGHSLRMTSAALVKSALESFEHRF
jgi:hypothetical protein